MKIYCFLEDKETVGSGFRRSFSGSERTGRTLKMGVIWFSAIAVSALIPILHFILVPLFFILALFMTYATWREQGQLVRGEFHCPSCQRRNTLSDESDDWPKERRCSACGFLLKLSDVPKSAWP
jgi:hypothetical protein